MKQIARLLDPPFEGLYVAPCGLELALRDGRLYAHEHAELTHALWHVGINRRVERSGDDDGRRTGAWVVWRVDDPGNRYDVERFEREQSARCVAATLEARAHKQSYGVEQRAPRPHPPLAGAWVLFRQDDGGVRYPMHCSGSRAALEDLAELFNREPRHKQVYFVEPGC